MSSNSKSNMSGILVAMLGVFLVLGAECAYAGTPVAPKTIYVDSDRADDTGNGLTWAAAKKTIQAGINLTNNPDDQVWVEDGTYTENIALSAYGKVYGGFAGDEVTFDARDTETYYVVIEPLDANVSVVTMSGTSTILDGFTITNGGASQGSGISVDTGTSDTIAIDNCIITGNNAIGGGSTGGGVYCTGTGTLNIADSSIVGNSALDGGGLSSDTACEIGFTNCVISGNAAGN